MFLIVWFAMMVIVHTIIRTVYSLYWSLAGREKLQTKKTIILLWLKFSIIYLSQSVYFNYFYVSIGSIHVFYI